MPVLETIDAIVTVGERLHWAVEKVAALGTSNTEAIQTAYACAKEDWGLERDRLMVERLERLEDTEENRARLDEMFTDEFFFLQENYRIEAFRAARRARRRMLAYAAAGSVDLNLAFTDSTRVERALRSLEPEDMMVLAKLAEQTEPVFDPGSAPQHHWQDLRKANQEQVTHVRVNRYEVAQTVPHSTDALLSTGCIRVHEVRLTLTPALSITELGYLGLRVLDAYVSVARTEGLMAKTWGLPHAP